MFTQIALRNIKSFSEAVIPLSPFTVLFGTNASGKSNVRDAFRFLHGVGRGYKIVDILAGKYEGGDQVWSGIRGGPFEFITSGQGLGQIEASLDRLLTYRIAVQQTDTRPPGLHSEELRRNEGVHFTVEPLVGSTRTGTLVHLQPDSYESSQVFSGTNELPLLSQIEDLPSQLIPLSTQVANAIHETKSAFESLRFLDLSPASMKEPTFAGQITLGDRGENLSTTLQYLIEERQRGDDIVEWLKALTPLDVAAIEFDRDARGRITLALVEHSKRRTSAESASDGTLRFLAYLALVFSTERPTTCFIEEIDNGIHPARLQLLVELLETQSKKRDIQVIASSHSPALMNLLNRETLLNSLLVYRTEGKTSSHIKPLGELPEFESIAERRRPGSLLETGWFEDTVEAVEDHEE